MWRSMFSMVTVGINPTRIPTAEPRAPPPRVHDVQRPRPWTYSAMMEGQDRQGNRYSDDAGASPIAEKTPG